MDEEESEFGPDEVFVFRVMPTMTLWNFQTGQFDVVHSASVEDWSIYLGSERLCRYYRLYRKAGMTPLQAIMSLAHESWHEISKIPGERRTDE